MPDGYGGMAASAGNLGTRDTLEFKSGEQLPFLLGEPSPALAVIEKPREQNG
jgi:hypothetical protein